MASKPRTKNQAAGTFPFHFPFPSALVDRAWIVASLRFNGAMPIRLSRVFTVCAWVSVAALLLNPINSRICRVMLLVALAAAAITTLLFVWRSRPLRFSLLLLCVLAPLPFLFPARPIDQAALHSAYVARLGGFQGVRYVWGGEGRLGIDCSGLPRKALREAMLLQGLKTANGTLVRGWAFHWWNDASARALAGEHLEYVHPLGISGTIRKIAYDNLESGDLAITKDGVHVLVYYGNNQWIQAEPGLGKVVVLDGRTDPIYWFDAPVALYRWHVFGE